MIIVVQPMSEEAAAGIGLLVVVIILLALVWRSIKWMARGVKRLLP